MHVQLLPQRLRQRSHLLIEQFLGLLPDTGITPVLQLHQAGHQRLTEHLRALTGKERGEMIDADHTKGWALGSRRQGDGHRGLVESSRDIIHGNGVVRVRAVNWSVTNRITLEGWI